MAIILSGKELALKRKDEMKALIPELEARYGRKPCLAVVIVGEDPASRSYVNGKIKATKYVGMDSRLIEYPDTVSEKELLDRIDRLNRDAAVDGILVQLPLPKHIDEFKVIYSIDKGKDADGFHPENVASLWLNEKCIKPCTPVGIMDIIALTGVNPEGKHAVVIGRSNIVGKPVAKLLMDANATVTMAHSHTSDLKAITLQADILVVAAGHPNLVTADMIRPGAIVIDVGMNRMEDGRLVGDVDFDAAMKVAGWISPVPGGVGPMTITMLMQNTIDCYLNRVSKP